jgi:hypothetical protein
MPVDGSPCCVDDRESMSTVEEDLRALARSLSPEQRARLTRLLETLGCEVDPDTWSADRRREAAERGMGCLAKILRGSSEEFARRKADEKAREERRWRTGE